MRIGQVAQIVGISARSIRHYHRLGVIAEPARTSGGYREYGVADLARIARIAYAGWSTNYLPARVEQSAQGFRPATCRRPRRSEQPSRQWY
ncbi:MerR family transcriptional regulator [Dietzia cinnamea]|uniref:MerR family transcriptional regulator n=1 Tax=Dietzia cinnamea TaxID=321318 RepID=UPI0035CCFFF2